MGAAGGAAPRHPWPLRDSTFMASLCPLSFWFHVNSLLWKYESLDTVLDQCESVLVGGAGLECCHQNNGLVESVLSEPRVLLRALHKLISPSPLARTCKVVSGFAVFDR